MKYRLAERDLALIGCGSLLLRKVAEAKGTTAAERVSVAKAQHVLLAMPRPSPEMNVRVTVYGPKRKRGDIEASFYWTVEIEGDFVSVRSGGSYFDPATGGDHFTSFEWSACPGMETDRADHRGELWMVPGLCTFEAGVAHVDLEGGEYRLEVEDEDNPLLEMEDEEEEEEDGEEDDENWVVQPVDEAEARLAGLVDARQVDAHDGQEAFGIEDCDLCGCSLSEKGLFVDGRLREGAMWANCCANCFEKKGAGIGWGVGQVFARQADGSWRLVAGFPD